jgi:hypothetical protein
VEKRNQNNLLHDNYQINSFWENNYLFFSKGYIFITRKIFKKYLATIYKTKNMIFEQNNEIYGLSTLK